MSGYEKNSPEKCCHKVEENYNSTFQDKFKNLSNCSQGKKSTTTNQNYRYLEKKCPDNRRWKPDDGETGTDRILERTGKRQK